MDRPGRGCLVTEGDRGRILPMHAGVSPDHGARPHAAGKFLTLGGEKFLVRGVTYGTFRPDKEGNEYQPRVVERDFAAMASCGINSVRTYTVPPRWLLDAAHRHGLLVMVGLPWEQHIAFLDERGRADAIEARVREGVRACANHPAVLCYAIGNEIPSSIVRWHGRGRIEDFLHRLFRAVKEEDSESLVTYVNYPSTEYLHLPFLDVVSFNVYLESQETLEAYLARLQNIAGDRPLILAELGLDSLRHGEIQQAHVLEWQLRSAFSSGCAGSFAFAWTDEWHRGGFEVEDWDFGLTRRDRSPKPALTSVRQVFAELPFPPETRWPRISVVVCTHNGSATLRDCLEGVTQLRYPDYEVIVVDDGSTDGSAKIASQFDVRLISTKNEGLSSARNTGWQNATGEIVAYTDDDARPDPDWLTYLAATFLTTSNVGVGGPNIAPAGDGLIAACVANAPGGPVHVLLSDREAEHIPGCNMAFRRDALAAIGGFDARYRAAGDDVDVCWRLQERGWKLGFSPSAMVWHHRRNSLRAYWKQQRGYGKAEALLEEKWPERYNSSGHVSWGGRLYGKGLTRILGQRQHVYHGMWGMAPFQSLYQATPRTWRTLSLMPEWYLVIACLAALSTLGVLWEPLRSILALLALAVAAPVIQAILSAREASFAVHGSSFLLMRLRLLTAGLHLVQPAARLWGRLRHGLTPWRRRSRAIGLPRLPQVRTVWSEVWRSPDEWMTVALRVLRAERVAFALPGQQDRWELDVRGGLLGSARFRLGTEEHGSGRQLLRFHIWPHISIVGLASVLFFALLAGLAWLQGAVAATTILAVVTGLLTLKGLDDWALALSRVCMALDGMQAVATPLGHGEEREEEEQTA